MSEKLNVFLAGIIQGSLPDTIHSQNYRTEIAALVKQHLPDAEVYDPFAEHPDSLKYNPEHGRDVFFELMDHAGRVDVLLAFVPEASMGTAIEMWNAFHAGAAIVCVSPLTENWVVRFLADAVLPDIGALRQFLETGRLEKLLEEKIGYEDGY
jgi:hypothetical protein